MGTIADKAVNNCSEDTQNFCVPVLRRTFCAYLLMKIYQDRTNID